MKEMKISATEKEYFESCVKEAIAASFHGWDFSYMAKYGGNVEEPKPWCYTHSVWKYLTNRDIVLDMGTGGGEFLAALQPLPPQIYATEAYRPNVPVAKARLEPLGVSIVEIEEGQQEDAPLPFADAFFEVIINRHETYDSKEVCRILQPEGVFITQQVGRRNNENLRMIFGSIENDEDFVWDLTTCHTFLVNAGLTILEAKEHIGYRRMYDSKKTQYHILF
jgi:SAM-dependent methyltransferase